MSTTDFSVKTGAAGRADRVFSFQGLGITIFLALLIVVFSFVNPRFFVL